MKYLGDEAEKRVYRHLQKQNRYYRLSEPRPESMESYDMVHHGPTTYPSSDPLKHYIEVKSNV